MLIYNVVVYLPTLILITFSASMMIITVVITLSSHHDHDQISLLPSPILYTNIFDFP